MVCLSGCGDSSEDATGNTPSGSVSKAPGSGPEVTVSDGDDSITTGATLPVKFPRGIIRFPLGFVVGQAQEKDVGGVRSWIVLGTVTEPRSPVRAELVAFHGEPDSESGDASFPNDDPVVLSWDDREGYTLRVTLTTNNDGDTVASYVVVESTS